MIYRNLGKSGINASVVGLGTWAAGGWMWGGSDRSQAVRAIIDSLENGINLIDTAPIYGFGIAEEIVGQALAGRRDKAVIATKCGLIWDKQNGEFFFTTQKNASDKSSEVKVYKYLSKESIKIEVENSLKRLGTDYIDLYQTHWQDSTTPVCVTMEALTELKEEGKIRAIGVSNVSPEQLIEYRKFGIIDSDQERFSMIDKKHESNLLPFCKQNDIAFLAYSPLEHGLLTGKYPDDTKFNSGDLRNGNPRFFSSTIKEVNNMLKEFEPLTEKYHAALSSLVIAWTFHQPGCSFVLAGARKPEHVKDNASAGEIQMSNEDLNFMDKIAEKHLPEILSLIKG